MTARPFRSPSAALSSLHQTDLDILTFRLDLGRRYGEPAELIRADLRCLAWSLSGDGSVEEKHISLLAWVEQMAIS